MDPKDDRNMDLKKIGPAHWYGNPDMHFLGTLKFEFQIWKVLAFLCEIREVFLFSGLISMFWNGNPEYENTKITLKTSQNCIFSVIWSCISWLKKVDFQCRYTVKKYKKCAFQWAGPIFLKIHISIIFRVLKLILNCQFWWSQLLYFAMAPEVCVGWYFRRLFGRFLDHLWWC